SLARRLPSGNTLTTAINLGSVTPNATRVSFRASGTVGKTDQADFYKFTIAPGANLPFGNNRYQLRNGPATFSFFVGIQGSIRFLRKFTLRQGSTSVSDRAINPTSFPITGYIRVERRTGETRYNLAADFFR
ncbi:MAG TPA: hypothetical protein V6C65_41190, partial [Allocoleopsis sp.]